MPANLRPADKLISVSMHPRFTREQLAEILAVAHPDADALAARLDSGRGLGLYDVKSDVVAALTQLGIHMLDAAPRGGVTDLHRKIIDYAYDFERELAHHEPTADELRPVLLEGLAFLYDVEHPPHPQVCTHHGLTFPLGTRRGYCFAPAALGPHSGAVLIVDACGWDCDGLAEGEIGRVVELLDEMGYATSSTWNGAHRGESGSIGLARGASRSLRVNVWGDRAT